MQNLILVLSKYSILTAPVMECLQESWLPTIRNLVAQINDTFSRNFKDMAVAGEVSLGVYLCFVLCRDWILHYFYMNVVFLFQMSGT